MAALVLATSVLAVKPGLNGKVAFTSARDGNNEIYVMNADGTGQTRLTNSAAADEDPSFSPDDTAAAKIAFTTDRDGNFEIYKMSGDGTGQTRLTHDAATDQHPAWSPNGSRIAFTSYRDGDAEVFVMNTDGAGVTQLTANSGPTDGQPAWSPDGSKIAFTTNRDGGGNYEIYVMNADGSAQTRLTTNAAVDIEPSWSPSGTQIAFATNRDGNYDVYKMRDDGTNQTNVSNQPGSTEGRPTWSPDGTKIALSTDAYAPGVNVEIAVGNTDGSGITRLTNSAGLDDYPDGQPEAVPDTTVNSGPTSPTNSTSATLTFSSNEAGVTFQCVLDGGVVAPCSSPATLTDLSEGTHTAQVRAVDAASNTDASPASHTWTVDLTAPQTTISAGPAQSSSSTQASFQFSSTESGSSFQCRLDGASAWSPCTSPVTLTALADASHTYEVRATDQAGNQDATAASYAWTVDSGAPETTIDTGPQAHTRSVSASFAFHASEAQVAFECKVDSEEFAPCTSPEPVSGLAPGEHTFQVRATDTAGNADATPASHVWTVDRRAPKVQATLRRSKGLTLSRAGLASFAGTASDAAGIGKVKVGLRISRRISSADERCRFLSLKTGRRIKHPCKSRYTLATGTTSWQISIPRTVRQRLRANEYYVLVVRATDLAGNEAYSKLRFRLS